MRQGGCTRTQNPRPPPLGSRGGPFTRRPPPLLPQFYTIAVETPEGDMDLLQMVMDGEQSQPLARALRRRVPIPRAGAARRHRRPGTQHPSPHANSGPHQPSTGRGNCNHSSKAA